MSRKSRRTPLHEEERRNADMDRKIDELIAVFTAIMAVLTGIMLLSAWL